MNLSKWLLKVFGWKVYITAPDYPKCIVCVAPHTSNWDFILGELAWTSVGRKAGFLMKESWFRWPLGYFFHAIGGIPVPRKKKGPSLVEALVERFRSADRLTVAITPEGTRKATKRWHTGFLRIAREANIPVLLGAIDFDRKYIEVKTVFTPSGDVENDLRKIKDFYSHFSARYPSKFTTEDE